MYVLHLPYNFGKGGLIMLINRVYETAKSYLEGSLIKDVVVGISLIAVELDNKNIGVSYVLREDLPSGCSAFPYIQNIIGKSAREIGEWVLTGQDDLKRGVGMAVLTAASKSQTLRDVESPDLSFGIEVLPTDRIGMIGFIPPIAMEFRKRAREVIIFDKGISQKGGNKGEVYSMEEQPKLLPKCDIVILSGTTMINNTIEELLIMCKNAREIVMVGASTPMFPEAFKDTKLTVLAGAWWREEYKDELFKGISLACGISYLQKYSTKKAVSTK
jgi:uncharacterized protein (DUF4213/DUF364 family)